MAQTKEEVESSIRELQYQYEALIAEGSYKLADQRLKRIKELKEQLKHMKDSMEILRLSGFQVNDACEKVFTKGEAEDGELIGSIKNEYTESQLKEASWTTWKYIINHPNKYTPNTVRLAEKLLQSSTEDGDIILPQHKCSDDDATENGSIEEFGKNKEIEKMSPEKDPTLAQDAERSVIWVKPSEINYKIGDIIQFKGKNVKITKITGNVVEAQVMDACSNKDSDHKVAEDGGPGSGIKGHSTIEKLENRQDYLENQIRKLKDRGDRYSRQMLKGFMEEYEAITRRLSNTKDSDPKVAEANALINLCGGVM